MHKDVAVITSTINPPILEDFLESIEKQSYVNFHIFLINISGQKLDIKNTSLITVVDTKNRGYSHCVNTGLNSAIAMGFTKFCIINDDTLFGKDFIKNVSVSLTKHPGSIIGGKIYYATGFEYHKQRYQKKELGNVIWYAGGEMDWDNVLSKHIGVDEVDTGQFDAGRETEFVTGALILFDKNVVDIVGFWDESYFLYFEDADFSMRAQKKGIRLIYDPMVVIWHKVSQSTEGSGSTLHKKYQERNRLRFGLKYAPLRTKAHLLKNFILERFKK